MSQRLKLLTTGVVLTFLYLAISLFPDATSADRMLGTTVRAQGCPSGKYDMVEFMNGATSLWPRANSSFQMNQVLIGSALAFVKFGNPATVEWYRYDAGSDAIHHHEDRTDGTGTLYYFTQDMWLRRCMSIGEVVNNSSNQLVRMNASCNVTDQHSFPYSVTLEAIWPNYYTGPDLGYRDVAVAVYHPTGSQHQERFYYAKGAGWAAWQLYQNGVMVDENIFNMLGGSAVQPDPPCRPLP